MDELKYSLLNYLRIYYEAFVNNSVAFKKFRTKKF